MGKIILIGTEHGDLKGSERLESLLEIVRPDILSVEFSLESLRLSQDDSADITKIISEARERGVSNTFIHFFEDLIAKLRKDPMRNAKSLAAALRYLTLIKQFNTNKRLQLKALQTILDN